MYYITCSGKELRVIFISLVFEPYKMKIEFTNSCSFLEQHLFQTPTNHCFLLQFHRCQLYFDLPMAYCNCVSESYTGYQG